MERKKTRLNESEMKVMQIIWNAGQPITGQQVLGQITEQYKGSWHPRTIYPLMRKLSEKGMIRDVGSARVGKVYARQFLPAISRPEYMALRIMETLPEAELPKFLSYFSYKVTIRIIAFPGSNAGIFYWLSSVCTHRRCFYIDEI